MPNTHITDKLLPAIWQLQGLVPNVYEHVHLGHYVFPEPGLYKVHTQIKTSSRQLSGSADSSNYFTVIYALFIDGVRVPTTNTFGVISQFGRWAVEQSNTEWLLDIQEPGEMDIRFGHYAHNGLVYKPGIGDWLGVAGGADDPNGRTWFRVERV